MCTAFCVYSLLQSKEKGKQYLSIWLPCRHIYPFKNGKPLNVMGTFAKSEAQIK